MHTNSTVRDVSGRTAGQIDTRVAWQAPELVDLNCDLDQVGYTIHGTHLDGSTLIRETS